jgi:hypothetical protein
MGAFGPYDGFISIKLLITIRVLPWCANRVFVLSLMTENIWMEDQSLHKALLFNQLMGLYSDIGSMCTQYAIAPQNFNHDASNTYRTKS